MTELKTSEEKKGSKIFALDLTDLVVVGKGALLVGLAAALTFVGENMADIDLGPATAFVVPVVTLVVHTLARLLKDNTVKDKE